MHDPFPSSDCDRWHAAHRESDLSVREVSAPTRCVDTPMPEACLALSSVSFVVSIQEHMCSIKSTLLTVKATPITVRNCVSINVTNSDKLPTDSAERWLLRKTALAVKLNEYLSTYAQFECEIVGGRQLSLHKLFREQHRPNLCRKSQVFFVFC